jgi:lipopolysaccharide export system ATP-binding protein
MEKPVVTATRSRLTTEGLHKYYGRRRVVNDVSVEVNGGEVVGLLGPNGAGKTTTFYMIVGMVRANAGTIRLDAADITHMPMYKRARLGIGYLPQEPSIFRGLSVEDNLMAVIETMSYPRSERKAVLDRLLGQLDIGHIRKSMGYQLSGGERRRVEIARALASHPNFILLDEPFAGIDPITVGDIRSLVSHLKDRGIGVLVTDHNVRDTLDIVDRAYILYEGKVLREGRPSEIVDDETVRRVYLGEKFSL